MSDSKQPEALRIGTVIDGRYRLTRTLGRGGFAWVYEGEHIELGRSVAIKVLSIPPEERKAAEFKKRFLREAQIIAEIKHPNVASLYDFGMTEGGRPYMAMELLQGRDLREELTHGPLEPARAKRLFVDALDALRAAHQAGIVHKDLKPANLFLAEPGTPEERLVVLDFGTAWARDTARLTKLGAFIGTPAYAAPEYAMSGTISPAVDVYQMGLILSEALTGIRAVPNGTSMEMMLAHCRANIIIPESLDATEFGAVVRRAAAFEVDARYKDCGELRDALAAVSTSDPIPVTERSAVAANLLELADTYEEATNPLAALATLVDDDDARAEPTSTPHALLAAVVVAFAALALLFYPTPDPEAPAPTVVLAVAVETPDEDVSERVEEETSTPLEQQAKFIIRSNPMGATVYVGQRRLGITSVILRGDAVDGSEVTLRYELPGYNTTEVAATLRDGGLAEVDLVSNRKNQGAQRYMPPLSQLPRTSKNPQHEIRAMQERMSGAAP